MTQHVESSGPTTDLVRVHLRPRFNEQGDHMLWLLSWLVDDAGTEGEWFYSGTGGDEREFFRPSDAVGIRVRRWPSPGLDPEYVDRRFSELGPVLIDRGLPFDRPQPQSVLGNRRS